MMDVGLDYLTLEPHRRDAVRRRGAAHPPGHADRLEPGRRALHARRAVHRAAPARQRAPAGDAAAAARPGQHGDRGRARPRHDPRRRPRHRHGPGSRRARRARRRRRHAAEIDADPASLTGQYLPAGGTIAVPRATPGGQRLGLWHSGARGKTTWRISTSTSRSARSPASPASPARARAPWSSTRSTAPWLSGCTAPRSGPGDARRDHRLAAARQGDRHRPGPDRAHAALQPGYLHRAVHPHPRPLRAAAGGARARLRGRGASRSTSRAAAAKPARATA